MYGYMLVYTKYTTYYVYYIYAYYIPGYMSFLIHMLAPWRANEQERLGVVL